MEVFDNTLCFQQHSTEAKKTWSVKFIAPNAKVKKDQSVKR
jgi:hypothetical protein